jgi:flagellar hook-associated protein 3 FlgL
MDRVSTSTAYQSILTNLMANESTELTDQQQVSSGMIADNLSGFGNQSQALVATQSVKARVDGLVSQLQQTGVQLTFQQTALTQISSVAQSLQTALSGAEGEGVGDNLMNQVQSLFSQAASALNTQYNGSYVFAGGQTATQPFSATSLADLTTQGSVSSFFQNGSLAPVTRIDDNTTVQTGFLASNVGSTLMGVFQSIQAFQQSGSGNFGGALTSAQQTFLDGAISQLNAVVASTNQTAAQGGDIQNQVSAALTTQTDRQTTLTGVLGTMTNADAAAAATNLTQAQTAFQASAQVFNVLKGMSLLNYLSSSTTVA